MPFGDPGGHFQGGYGGNFGGYGGSSTANAGGFGGSASGTDHGYNIGGYGRPYNVGESNSFGSYGSGSNSGVFPGHPAPGMMAPGSTGIYSGPPVVPGKNPLPGATEQTIGWAGPYPSQTHPPGGYTGGYGYGGTINGNPGLEIGHLSPAGGFGGLTNNFGGSAVGGDAQQPSASGGFGGSGGGLGGGGGGGGGYGGTGYGGGGGGGGGVSSMSMMAPAPMPNTQFPLNPGAGGAAPRPMGPPIQQGGMSGRTQFPMQGRGISGMLGAR